MASQIVCESQKASKDVNDATIIVALSKGSEDNASPVTDACKSCFWYTLR